MSTLPTAASILVRQLEAYGTLVACDFEVARGRVLSDIVGRLVLYTALCQIVILAGVCVIASTWNTPARLPALGGLAGLLLAAALLAIVWFARHRRSSVLFPLTAAQWKEDRSLLEQLIGQSKAVVR